MRLWNIGNDVKMIGIIKYVPSEIFERKKMCFEITGTNDRTFLREFKT